MRENPINSTSWEQSVMKNFALITTCSTLVCVASTAPADILQWEYINPADPNKGKRQSTTLAPDGAGVDAVPFSQLSNRNLTMAYLIGADLTNAFGYKSDLTSADLSHANLTYANFDLATLTDADFTDTEVRRANFNVDIYSGFVLGTGITLAQLYSTASYQNRNLVGIRFSGNDLSGGNFAGQYLTGASFREANLTRASLRQANLTGAYFFGATLANADFTDALVNLANLSNTTDQGFTAEQLYSTASYKANDLGGIDLSYNDLAGGWSFAGQDLTNASFYAARLTDVDLTGAEVRRANFNIVQGALEGIIINGTGLTLAQLYSTASYQAHDLSGVGLIGSDLAGGNFAGQNLSNSKIRSLPRRPSILSGADLTGADTRGAEISPEIADVVTTNLILAQMVTSMVLN